MFLTGEGEEREEEEHHTHITLIMLTTGNVALSQLCSLTGEEEANRTEQHAYITLTIMIEYLQCCTVASFPWKLSQSTVGLCS